jgi:hypothetical protein
MIEIDIADAHNAFIVHDDETFFAQLPKWIKVEFAPYNGRCKYVSKIEYGTPSYEKLGMLWDDPNRPMYNSYPTMREVYRVSTAVYNDCLEQLNDKLDQISKYMFIIGGDKGNPIIRKSSSSFRYATQISWGVFSENTSDEEIVKVLNSHF